jgi:hypothetical protein
MERLIPWIGYARALNGLALSIEESDLGRVERLTTASDGLMAITARKYPIILINSNLRGWDFTTSEGINPEDDVQIGCSITRKIREGINKDAPIILTHTGWFPRYKLKQALDIYSKAGITDFFKWYAQDKENFLEVVRRNLR